MPHPTPQAAIAFNPETGQYGFSVWFPGKRPHYSMEVFTSEEAARQWLDPLDEREWEPAPAAGMIALSRGYKAGSVPSRV